LKENTACKVAGKYGVSSTQLLKWRKSYGLEVNSKPYLGLKRPSKDYLAKLLSEFCMYEIAEKLGVHFNTVTAWRKFYDLDISGLEPPSKEELIELSSKMPIGKVAEMYGIGRSVLTRWKKLHGVDIRYSDARMPSKEELSELLPKLFISEIARKYSVNPNTVSRWKKVYGLTTKIKSRKERWTQIKAEKSIEDSNYMESCVAVVQGMKDSLGITPEQHKENEQRLRDRVILY
jgi:transposase-like protein